jgi:hypothetical protein
MHNSRPTRAALALGAVVAVAAVAIPAVGAGAVRVPVASPLREVQALPALPAGAAPDGAVRADARLGMRVVLQPRDPAALDAFVAAVSSPSSGRFRRFLPRGAFAARFGPTSAAIAAVRAQLGRDGLDVAALSASHLVLTVRGTAARFAAAFHAPLERWRLRGGAVGYELARPAALPTAVAADVAGVVGVSSMVRERSFAVRAPRARVHGARVTSSVRPAALRSAGGPGAGCAGAVSAQGDQPGSFLPQAEGQAYGLDTAWGHGFDGAGHTVAVEEFAPYSLQDELSYVQCFGVVPAAAGSDPLLHNVLVDGGTSPGSAAASDEPTLDVEEIRGLAPGANVDVYLGPNDVTGPLDVLQRIATDDTAQAVSISWGICEAFSDHAAETPVFQQLAAQGQSVYAASGDSGSSDCIAQSPPSGPELLTASVDDPASQPLVTGVGALTVNQPLAPLQETVWNDCVAEAQPGCLGDATGGGVSAIHARPGWQDAPGTPGVGRGAHARLVPDLSVIGDPTTGMLFDFGGSFSEIGGTSMGAPLMSALDVVAAQSCAAATFGLVNPLLYAMGRHGGDFHDVRSGNNAISIQAYDGREFFAGPGYDMASGLGSPAPATFLPALCDGTATATATPDTPRSTALWAVTFHTGAATYPVGATVTVTAPPGTALPGTTSSWVVADPSVTAPPSAVALRASPGSATDNVAVLTVATSLPPVDAVTLDAVNVSNPASVGVATVRVTNSTDALAAIAPLTLAPATPSAAHTTVAVAPRTTAAGGPGAVVRVTVRDAAGDLVLGAPVTATATGHGRATATRRLTSALGTATLRFRDARVQLSTTTVTAGGVPVGSTAVRFVDPWTARALRPEASVGRLAGRPAVATVGTAWVALVRARGGRLVVGIPRGRTLRTAVLPRSVAPPIASNPSLVFARGWLYATYRATSGDLIVLRQGGRDHLRRWHALDLTATHRVPTVLFDPRLVVAGHGAGARLSIAVVTRAHVVVRATATLAAPTRFAVLVLSDLAGLVGTATGDVAEVPNGGNDAFVFRTLGGQLLMVARQAGHWQSDDLAQSALLSESGPLRVEGDPAVVADGSTMTVMAVTADHRVDEFVGTFDSWSAVTVTGGATGSSPPAGHATLPGLTGEPVVFADGATAAVVLETEGGRLVELRTPGVETPWSSFDLTSLARVRGGTTGATALPGGGVRLLCAVGDRLVLLRGGAI